MRSGLQSTAPPRRLTGRALRACLLWIGLNPGVVMAQDSMLLLDDFSRTDRLSAVGTQWQGFSDRVMGGLSELRAGFVETDGERWLRMQGRVRLENNGGFIQLRLPLRADGGDFDATGYRALRVQVRGTPGAYWLHLRSADTRRPWAYYRAPLAVSRDWASLDLPLADFEPVALRQPLDTQRLRSVALVAYGEAFEADVELRWIGLLR
jgi:hypothetical protein